MRTFQNVFSYHRHVKDGMRMRHFPVMVGSGTSETIKKRMVESRGKKLTFFSQPNPVQTVFGGSEPKFCLTIQKMASPVSDSRVKTLTSLFNFVFNEETPRRMVNIMDVNYNTECLHKEGTVAEAKKVLFNSNGNSFYFSTPIFAGYEETGYAGGFDF